MFEFNTYVVNVILTYWELERKWMTDKFLSKSEFLKAQIPVILKNILIMI